MVLALALASEGGLWQLQNVLMPFYLPAGLAGPGSSHRSAERRCRLQAGLLSHSLFPSC